MNSSTTPTTAQANQAAQPTERRARQRPTVRACTAQHCHQGRRACPCPQACEQPTTSTTDPLADEPASAMELLGLALGVVAVAMIVVFALKACAAA